MGFCSRVLFGQDKTQNHKKPTIEDILALLQPIEDSFSKTTRQQMSRVMLAMLAMTGRVTMLGLSRWAGKGGSYRTIQRFLLHGDPLGASVLAVF